MKKLIAMLILSGAAASLFTGCVTADTQMVCFSPVNPGQYESGEQLLADINAELPFPLSAEDFTCSRQDGLVLAWVAMDDAARSSELQKALRKSRHFQHLSVGYFAKEDRELFALGPSTYRF